MSSRGRPGPADQQAPPPVEATSDYREALRVVLATAAIREDRVADLRRRIAAGTYRVSADELAGRLLGAD